jgi:hypothetical protein
VPTDSKDLIQQIVEEASTMAGNGAQFLPIVIIIEVVAALVTIWSECRRKNEAVAMIRRAQNRPRGVSAEVVRSKIYQALPPEYKSPEFVEHIIQVAAEKLKTSAIPLD